MEENENIAPDLLLSDPINKIRALSDLFGKAADAEALEAVEGRPFSFQGLLGLETLLSDIADEIEVIGEKAGAAFVKFKAVGHQGLGDRSPIHIAIINLSNSGPGSNHF